MSVDYKQKHPPKKSQQCFSLCFTYMRLSGQKSNKHSQMSV